MARSPHDAVLAVLAAARRPLTTADIRDLLPRDVDAAAVTRALGDLSREGEVVGARATGLGDGPHDYLLHGSPAPRSWHWTLTARAAEMRARADAADAASRAADAYTRHGETWLRRALGLADADTDHYPYLVSADANAFGHRDQPIVRIELTLGQLKALLAAHRKGKQ